MQNNMTSPLQGLDLNTMGKLFSGMNLSSLAGMLNGININQLLPLIPVATKMMGGLFANNSAPVQSVNPGFIPQAFGQNPNAAAMAAAEASPFAPLIAPHINDPRIVVLSTMKPFLPQDKIRIIDSIIGVLAVIFTINSVLPRRPAVIPTAAVSPTPAPPVVTPVVSKS